MPADKICVLTDDDMRERAATLAGQLKAPVRTIEEQYSPNDCQFILSLTNQRVELLIPGSRAKALSVDFIKGAFGYRRGHGGERVLRKAVGGKKCFRPEVIDATAGLGRDGFLLAAAGCRVTMCERDPVVAALLEDGLLRARNHPETMAAADRITLLKKDATAVFKQMAAQGRRVDAVYLDPMFPTRSKAAKVKKELRFLQLLLGPDNDTSELFQTARIVADRIVVKRPASAPPLVDKPSHSLQGKTTRFDIYLTAD